MFYEDNQDKELRFGDVVKGAVVGYVDKYSKDEIQVAMKVYQPTYAVVLTP